MQETLIFESDGLKLSAVLHVPDGHGGGPLPAFVVLHGFVGSKDESHAQIQAQMLEHFGYAPAISAATAAVKRFRVCMNVSRFYDDRGDRRCRSPAVNDHLPTPAWLSDAETADRDPRLRPSPGNGPARC